MGQETASFLASAIGITFGLILIAALIAVQIFYILSLFKAMNAVPEEKRLFPSWFVWMFLVPLANFVFMWIMVPFGVPKSLGKAVEGNAEAESRAKGLFALGLSLTILVSISWIPVLGIFTGIAAFILWIIYWVKVVSFRRDYLEQTAA